MIDNENRPNASCPLCNHPLLADKTDADHRPQESLLYGSGGRNRFVSILAVRALVEKQGLADDGFQTVHVEGLCEALLHGGFERRDGAVVESFTQRVGNWLARVCAFG